jgi:RHH-type proline utilization regulon transcriptional repressor/proline dehydrogenase/delta 1-pyrroline-5-carboxylate dehydrogenase
MQPDEEPTAEQLLKCFFQTAGVTVECIRETDDELADQIRSGTAPRLRFTKPDRVHSVLREAARASGDWLADAHLTAHGRLELLWYLQEQSVSDAYHRYGNLGLRAEEPRAAVP